MKDRMSKQPEILMRRATLVSLYLNVVLVLMKVCAVVMVNSLAIAVDLGISFVGLAVSVILYYSVRLASKPADLMHNYGYGKVEHVCEGMEGVVLMGIALIISFESILNLIHPEKVSLPWVGMGVSMTASVLNFIGARYILNMAQKSGSPAIRAEAIHWRMEGFISGAISAAFIVSIILSRAGREHLAHYVDPLAALGVSLFLAVPSFKLAKSSFFNLLDASVEEGSQIEILKQLSRYIDRYCEFRDLRTRTSGRKKFIEFDLVVPEDMSFRKGHEIVAALEKDLESVIEDCEVSISLKPCEKDCDYARKGQACPYLKNA